jgi:DNA-binding MarR family transcriptional regulator
VHKCLSILEREGFILLEVDPRDTRRRIVSPTDRARKLLSRLAKRVNAWADSLNT